jgi:hypothetical protein
MEQEHEDHGHSIASWTLVIVVLVGAAVGAVAVLLPNLVVGIVAAVIVVLGVVAGKVLALAGYGAKPHATQHESLVADAPEESGTSTLGAS